MYQLWVDVWRTDIFIHIERLDIFEWQIPTFTVLNKQLVCANWRAAYKTIEQNISLTKCMATFWNGKKYDWIEVYF